MRSKFNIWQPNTPSAMLTQHRKISNQIQCVMREIRRREVYYPMAIIRGKMTQEQADYELNCMKSVYHTLVLAEQAHLDKKFNQKEIQ
ncbi:MAG: hypothetical protein ACI4OE_07135 [Alphaproteobacteria bacterium]